ncbi:MAG: response regulator transcription factor [Fimbriimonadaceae bacterium]|nr:response regulator transcription factor [Chitinophagales bacterium]
MISALIIDDEESVVNVVRLLLQKHVAEITQIYTAIGAVEGLSAIRRHSPALIFLDIEMPLMSGFEILKHFREHEFEVIFITAYDHYAIKAIKYSALDYLLKPIDSEELKQAVKKYIEKQASTQWEKEKYRNLLHNLNEEKISNYRLAVSTTDGTFFLSPKDIIRLEADGNYTRFYLKEKKPIITSKTLKEYDELLSDQDFIRVHRAHLVNKKYVNGLSGDHELTMTDNSIVEVSRRKWDEVKEKLYEN